MNKRKCFKIITMILTALVVVISSVLLINKVFANVMGDWAAYSYADVAGMDPATLLNASWSYDGDSVRFSMRNYLCLEKYTTTSSANFYVAAVIDVNPNGDDYTYWQAYCGSGATTSGNDARMAKLAYISNYADKNKWSDSYDASKAFSQVWDVEGAKNLIPGMPESTDCLANSLYQSATAYANSGATEDNEVISARILIFKGGAAQNTAILYGDTTVAKPKIKIDKYITDVIAVGQDVNSDGDIHLGDARAGQEDDTKKASPVTAGSSKIRVSYTITLTNEGSSDIVGTLADYPDADLTISSSDIPYGSITISPGDTKTYHVEADVNQSISQGFLQNMAEFTPSDGGQPSDSSDWLLIGDINPPDINKYITSIDGASFARSNMDETAKQSNPADAGTSDSSKSITYIVTLTNNNPIAFTGTFEDTPASGITINSITANGMTISNGGTLTLGAWSTTTVTVNATISNGLKGGVYRNTARFKYGKAVLESSDYFKIKEDLPEAKGKLKKYVSNVTGTDGTFKSGRESMDVSTKYSYPAEVERGALVTYTIELEEYVPIDRSNIEQDHDGNFCPDHYELNKLDWVKCLDTYDPSYLQYVSCTGSHSASFDTSENKIVWKDVEQSDDGSDVKLTAELTFRVVASNMKMMNVENKVSDIEYQYKMYKCKFDIHNEWHEATNVQTDEEPWCDHTDCDFTHEYEEIHDFIEGEDYDYVRLLDPEIAGVVFLDKNDNDLKDGSDENLGQVIREQYKKVSVELWNSTRNEKVDEKFVNPETGEFSFGRVRKGEAKNVTEGSGHQGVNAYTDIGVGNYFYYEDEVLYQYYIIYNYDGERYEAVKNAGTSHLNPDYSMMSDFPNDSNADELEREEFNSRLETIANDKAFKGTVNDPANRKEMEYETVDAYGNETSNLQVSTALWDGEVDSVLNIKAQSIDLFFPDKDTEYLLHINLGIEERDHADLSLTKDVVKADVTVNGFITTYEYEKLGTDEYVANNDNTLKTPYVLRIYREDYEFRTKNYDTALQTIMNDNNPYKDMGRDNDLQIILTYKITITNNSDNGKEAVVREVVDYCSEELEMVPGTAMLDSEDSGIEVQDDTSSKFANEVAGTNTYLYGNNLESKRLQPGESLDIYLKYRVLKDSDHYILVDKESDEINNKKYNIAEVGAYSIYESGKAAGLVDINSNPANSRKDDGSFDPADFEDDTFETAIAVVLRDYPDNPPPDEPNPEEPPNDPPPPENPPGNGGEKQSYRNISGVVFEEIDKKVDNSDGQLVADGTKDQNDIFAKNVLVKLYEVIRGKTGDGSIVDYLVDTGMWYRTGDDGRYYFGDKVDSSLNGTSGYNSVDDRYRLHAGLYKVRFVYGDEFENLVTEDGTTIKYSGQDYQSTKYTEIGNTDDENEILEVTKFSTYGDTFTTDISTPIRSLAKDNEVRRLEVNAYSTTTTYPMDTVLKAGEATAEAQVLAEHTAMFADTKAFNMQIEHYGAYEKFGDVAEKTIDGMKTYYYSVRDIDFGLTERPKTKLQLMNDISEVRAITSDGATLLDIFFDIMYEKEQDEHGIITGIKHTAVPNMAKSKGLSQVQVLNRNGNNQGFRYANIDSDLLQGMTITIKFQIAVANTSEVDHLAGWLEEKIQERPDVDLKVDYSHLDTDLTTNVDIGSDGKQVVDTIRKETRTYDYSRSYLNRLIYEGGDIESGSVSALNSASTGIFSYADRETIGSESIKKAYTYANIKLIQPSYEVGYYLGNIYYNNEYTGDEAVVNTRVDQFIDYVDNDLIFKPEENLNENKQMTYLTYTTKEIAERGLLREITDEIKVISDGEKDYYNADVSNANNNLAFNIEDAEINPYFYKFLPTVPDEAFAYEISEVTMGYDWDKDDLDNPISPDVKVRTIGNPYNNDESYNYREDISQYLYVIDLEASRVLTSEADIEGVAVDNLAEIIKVTNTAGRKVYVKASQDATGYIGNTTKDPIETETFVELSRPETDTDFTEYVTFSPPTGLSQGQLAMRETIEKATNVLLIGVPTIIIIAGVSYVTVQVVKRKKFYK